MVLRVQQEGLWFGRSQRDKQNKETAFVHIDYTKLARNVKAGECEMIMVLFLERMQAEDGMIFGQVNFLFELLNPCGSL
jgi:hypothetical protein